MRRTTAVTLMGSRLWWSRTSTSPHFDYQSTKVSRIKLSCYQSSESSPTPHPLQPPNPTDPPPPLSPPPSLFDQEKERSKNSTTTTTTSAPRRLEGQPQPQRRRHRFTTGGSADEIPSFRDFQQKKQIWSLYRQFTRLVFQSTTQPIDSNSKSNSSSDTGSSGTKTVQTQRSEMQSKIQTEFRLTQSDNWHIQRALSEGSRRYKELSAMLGNSVKRKQAVVNDSSSTSEATKVTSVVPASSKETWPWNRSVHDAIGKGKPPPVFPRKSNG